MTVTIIYAYSRNDEGMMVIIRLIMIITIIIEVIIIAISIIILIIIEVIARFLIHTQSAVV